MDPATIVGIISAFSLVIMAMLMGGGVNIFVNIPSLMIVVGGTFGASLINYPLKDIFGVVSVVRNAFFHKEQSPREIIAMLVQFGEKVRKEGILSLENSLKEVSDDFLKKGIQMAVDGLEPKAMEDLLRTEIDFLADRHKLGAEILATMGAFAPAMGLIGTLIGLVQMLQSMDDPSSIGPAMAVALLTTFYGALMANLIFLPISGKLKARSGEESLVKEVMLEGIISIVAGDNPRVIEQKLHVFLAPRLRETAFKV